MVTYRSKKSNAGPSIMVLRYILLVLIVAGAAAGIYPDGHFDVSTKLTVDNFEPTVQAAIDAGKTMFVRWIASEG